MCYIIMFMLLIVFTIWLAAFYWFRRIGVTSPKYSTFFYYGARITGVGSFFLSLRMNYFHIGLHSVIIIGVLL